MPANLLDLPALLESVCSPEGSEKDVTISLCDAEVLFCHHPCPSFICSANDNCNAGPIVLVQPFSQAAKKRPISITTKTPSPRKKSSQSDLDVTGSPLRLHFADCDFEDSPFTVKTGAKIHSTGPIITTFKSKAFTDTLARSICSELHKILNCSPNKHKYLPIYILADGTGSKRAILYGISPSSSPTSRVRSLAWRMGPHLTQKELVTLQSLRNICTGPAVSTYVDTKVCAVYEVVSVLQDSRERQEAIKRSAQDDLEDATILHMSCFWNKPIAVLCSPPPDAASFLTIKVPVSSNRGLLSKDLKLLSTLVKGLEARQIQRVVREGSGRGMLERMEELFENHQAGRGGQSHRPDVTGTPDFDDVISGKISDGRTDFMHSLWVLLSDFCSLQDLRIAFRHLFSAFSSGKVRPQVHFRDTTKIAELARSLMKGDMPSGPDLEGVAPLLMLIELGLCDVSRDLGTVLLAGELATREQLAPFLVFPPEGGVSPSTFHQKSLHSLHQLQLVIHVVSNLRHQLRLDSTVLAGYTSQMLQELKDTTEDVTEMQHLFTFPLQTSGVRELLDGLPPILWQVTMATGSSSASNKQSRPSSEGVKRTLTMTVSRTELVRLVSPDDELADLSLAEEGNIFGRRDSTDLPYYATFYSAVEDSMFSIS